MDIVVVLFIALMVALAFGFFGAWICGEKGRDRNPGMVIGFLFGPLGCLILALLPAKPPEQPRSTRKPKPRWDAETADFRVESFGKPKYSEDDDNVLRYLDGKN